MAPTVDKFRAVKVAVLMGGPSEEHEVSLKSGKNIIAHLDGKKYRVKPVMVGKGGEWPIEPEKLKKNFDIAFIAMHGPYGEDGTVQVILEEIGLPYTGSGVLASALAMNKYLSLQLLKDHGLAVPRSLLVSKLRWQEMPAFIVHQLKHYFGYPLVVKPNDNGSSIATAIVENEHALSGAFNEVFSVSREALIQPYIRGREATCGVLDHGWAESAYALPPTEIVPKVSRFFDYRAKYDPKGSDEITPASFGEPMNKIIQRTAIRAHQILGCRHISRTDMIFGSDKNLYVLEVNTIPGMTAASLIPRAAQAVGISFTALLDRLIQAALSQKWAFSTSSPLRSAI